MLLVVITFLLMTVGVVSYIIGAWQLSRYAARMSGGLGAAVLLLPPVAFWFAFFKLEQEGKEMPTTLWLFGMVSTLVLLVVFWTPISMVASGRMAELDAPTSVGDTAVAEYGAKPGDDGKIDEEPTPAPEAAPEVPAPAATNNAAAGTNNAAAGTNSAAGGTNSAAAGTNNAAANANNGAANATNGAAAPAEQPAN